MKTRRVIICLLGLLLLHFALCDLPVHCEYSQILGKWTLRTTANTFPKEVVNSCELRKPIVSQGEITVELEAPNIIKNTTHQIGTWVLIYDQGFELIFHGQKFFAFFNYTEQGDTVISDCDHTLTGWYHEDRPKPTAWGCFRGYKHHNATAESLANAPNDRISVDSLAAISLYKFGKAYRNEPKRIDAINKVQKSWKAKPMKQWEGMPLKQFYKKLGVKHDLNSAKRIAAHRRHKEEMKRYNNKRMMRAGAEEFPKEFDWRNVSGENYVTKVRDQQLCGSCYAMAAMAMYESRIRILSRLKEQPIYSPQDIVSCSQYSQQCDGGFPYLVSKYGQDFGFIEEKCNTYKGIEFVCEDNCPQDARIYVKEYGYVGGYYGASNEDNMIQALLTYGPLVVGIEVDEQFYNYESGIFHHVNETMLMLAGDIPPSPPHFETVNHAVLLVGYGEENGEKFWTIRNSWSEEWGEAGYARIRRSTDEIGIESDVTFGDLLVEGSL